MSDDDRKIELTFTLRIDPQWLGNWFKNLVLENIHKPSVMEAVSKITSAIASKKKE